MCGGENENDDKFTFTSGTCLKKFRKEIITFGFVNNIFPCCIFYLFFAVRSSFIDSVNVLMDLLSLPMSPSLLAEDVSG